MRARSNPPNERSIVGVRSDGATEGADCGTVRPAMVANESSLFDLTGKMIPCTLQAVVKAGYRGDWIEDVDYHRGYERVHFRPWTFEALQIGAGGKPITGGLLMLGENRSRASGTNR